uniref:(California timema) hypothetical protein n=1 Tax=Timema californicum TaxID=61474 RepID=A0A7R9J1R4_TIMCA|nr:unnamed protein product [Timema californicum]
MSVHLWKRCLLSAVIRTNIYFQHKAIFNFCRKSYATSCSKSHFMVINSNQLCASNSNYYFEKRHVGISKEMVHNSSHSHARGIEEALLILERDVKQLKRIFKADLHHILQDILVQGLNNGDTQPGVLLVQCCGDLIPDMKPSDRLDLVHQVWETLEKLGVNFSIAHYNALLRCYAENSCPVSLDQFLSNMVGVQPNEETYHLLLKCVCEVGDIEAATKVISIMKEKGFPASEPVFNTLILGHARTGDIHSAAGVLVMMRSTQLEPTAATYSAMLQGYATVGDVAGLQETYQKAANAHIALSEKQILEVLKCAVITGHRNLMTRIIKWLPILDMETGMIARNLAIHLVHLGHEEAAFALLDILPTPPTGSKEEAAGIGSFLLREAVVADRPLSAVVKLCDRLMSDGRNTLALTKVAHVCLGTERVESSLVVFKAMLERGLKLRPHYFWPIFLTNARLLGEKGVFDTIQHMTDLGVALDFDTLADYVLPHVSLADPPMLVRKLQGCGMTVGALLTPVVATLLRQGRIGPAGKLFFTIILNMKYTQQQRLYLGKTNWITISVVVTQITYQRKFSVQNPPERNTILALVHKLETTGTLVSETRKHGLSALLVVAVDAQLRLLRSPSLPHFPPRHTLPRLPRDPLRSRCQVYLISHLDTRCRDFPMTHCDHVARSSSFPTPTHIAETSSCPTAITLPGLPHFPPLHTLPRLPHDPLRSRCQVFLISHLDTRCRDFLMTHCDHVFLISHLDTRCRDFPMTHCDHVAKTSSFPTLTPIDRISCPTVTHFAGTSSRPITTHVKFQKEGLHISSFACESICQNLLRTPGMDSYTEKVKETLEALVDSELGINNSELFSQLIPHPRDMNIEELECHLVELKSKGLNTRGVLRRLLQLHCRHGNLERALAIKQEFEAAGHEFSAGMIACMFDAHVRFGSLEDAQAYFKELTTSAPSFTLDHFKVVDFATMLVTKGKQKEAVSLLNKYPANIRGKGSLGSISRNCLRLLTATSKSGEGAATTRDMLNLLVKQGYCTVNNIMLGPLIRAHLNRMKPRSKVRAVTIDFIQEAAIYFLYNAMTCLGLCQSSNAVAVEHGCTPLQHEVLCRLVVEAEKGPTGQALLQETIKAGQQVHRMPNTHIALIMALAETGQEKQLRRLLMDPSVKLNSSLLLARCQRLVDEDKLEPLQAIVSSTYNNANFNNTPIFTYMLQIFNRRGDCDGALSLWTSMQERDVQPPPQFLDQLAALLHSHKRAVPFVTSADHKVQSDTAAT